MKRAAIVLLAADVAYCLWVYIGRPGGRCKACRARRGLAEHVCVWAAASDAR